MTTSRNLPWPCLALALVTLVAVFLTAGKVPMLLPITIAIVASYAVRLRVPEGPLVLLVGFALLLAALFLTPEPGDDGPLQIGPARTRNLIAMASTIGVLLQFWVHRPSDPERAPLYIVLFSAFALTAACNTYEERFARFFIPVFALLAALCLRATRPRRPTTLRSALPVGLAVAMALLIGATGNVVVSNYRTQIMEWGNRITSDRAESEVSGLTDQPTLGPMFGQRGGARRILRLEDYRGDGHLRGMSFWRYEGGRWGPPVSARSFAPFTGDDAVAPVQGRRGVSSRVERLALDNPIVYAPLSARNLVFGDIEKIDWCTDGGPILIRRGGPDGYTFYALGDDGQGLLAGKPKPNEIELMLAVPDALREPLHRIAVQATAGARDDRDRIQRLEAYLMARHPYSLRYSPGRGDPVLQFVTHDGVGAHCEFFASAATLMLRTLGIPTRYVTGFFAHEEESEHQTVVRQRDAHAWAEAYLKGVGWVTVEATPPSGMPDVQSAGTGIEWWRALTERFQDLWSHLKAYLAELETDQLVLMSLIPLGVAALGFLLRRRKKRLADAPVGYPTPAEMAALAERFDRLLARRGIPAPAHRPWSEHLERLPDTEAAFRTAAEAFVALYDAARFGGDTDRGALEAALESALRIPPPPVDTPRSPGVPSRQ